MISVAGLYFQYGHTKIIQNVNFNIGRGEIVGLLGPNGAGKTTCLRLLSGYMPATSGAIHINNAQLTPNATDVRRNIGYVPEQAPLHDMLTPHEHVQLALESHGLGRENKLLLLEKFDLLNVQHHPVQLLSKGYRRRVALAMAFAASPAVLLLDEPGDGLDPNQKNDLATTLQTAAQHAAILFSTHQLSDVERFCTRVLLMHQRRICFDGTPLTLRDSTAAHTLDAAFAALTQVMA